MVRECGRDVTCPDAKEVLYTLKERAYVEQIEKAYNYASKVLLDFLMEEKELVSRLRFLFSTLISIEFLFVNITRSLDYFTTRYIGEKKKDGALMKKIVLNLDLKTEVKRLFSLFML